MVIRHSALNLAAQCVQNSFTSTNGHLAFPLNATCPPLNSRELRHLDKVRSIFAMFGNGTKVNHFSVGRRATFGSKSASIITCRVQGLILELCAMMW